MQHADRIRSTLLFTHILDQRVDLSDTWNWRKRLQKNPLADIMSPGLLRCHKWSYLHILIPYKLGDLASMSRTIRNSQ